MEKDYREESSVNGRECAQKSLPKSAAERSTRENGRWEKEEGRNGGGPTPPKRERVRSYEIKRERGVKKGMNERVNGS